MITSQIVENIPASIGVYTFLRDKKPLYIGKATHLKARLKSHLRNAQFDPKERRIITEANSVTYKTTISEFEALLLEAKLISRFKPKYNVTWRDDKSYLYIKITLKERFPKIYLVRKENDGQSLYFGPFASTSAARYLLNEIRKVVPFCTQKQERRRCFYAKIGYCDPCPSEISRLEKQGGYENLVREWQRNYRANVNRVVSILKGKSYFVFDDILKKIEKAARLKNFEQAIVFRDRLELLKSLVFDRAFYSNSLDIPTTTEAQLRKSVLSALQHIYQIRLTKKNLRIECFDISNIYGRQAAASMVVFVNGVAEKSQYRKFKIKHTQGITDTGMIAETLMRRFAANIGSRPDLIIIDGGKPQVRAASKVLKSMKIDIPLLGIAKNPDRLIGNKSYIRIDSFEGYQTFYNMARAMRDEAHRFAKKYHLILRNKKVLL